MKKTKPATQQGLTRRDFIHGMAAATGSLILPGCGNSTQPGGSGGLPPPEESGIDHIVVLMMENRSFDHFLGWVPGADGVQAGVSLKDKAGNTRQSRNLAPNFQNCQLADPDHSYDGGRIHVNDGKMDGFLMTQPVGDDFAVGYYTADSLPFYKGCAEHWTICDRYFSSMLGLTTPNRIYMHAGQTDRLVNSVEISKLPTVWDRMIEKGRSVAYYYQDVSYLSFWGSKYTGFSNRYTKSRLKSDVMAGRLANLTYIDNVGSTFNEGGSLSRDDHPVADIRDGQAFLNEVYDILRQGPDWERTLLVINYDEWGGFYDHVPPPFAPVTAEEAALGNDGRLGGRVPCVIIGPRARRGHVEHQQFDPNSILNMIAWRFGFEPLGARASSTNLAHALDFSSAPKPAAPAFDVPGGPFGGLCLPLATILHLAGLESPVPLPELPVVPLPEQIQLPPIPGLDEPLLRLVSHVQELDVIRRLGAGFGF
ncbi:alkaline phosphatase family protein [Solimonas sp. SE-A11]|uniref:alkaline phosphatase family protein n=1 Tax=Solimonas sp. SE-A11 TaxID=3054954 RepID=UPI00259CC0EB|nr:alkaline phosphatase family protein [Solimonas sp. SE-A11]MDM4769345.1 alkaline phosphatase family protein [Solimonas sp. SE-A11]